MRNMDSGDLFVFHVDAWFSKTKDDGKIVRDVVATFKGKKQLKSWWSIYILDYSTNIKA